MFSISRSNLEKLADAQAPFCISIYIPTHRVGKDVNEGKDKIELKNQLRHAREILIQKGFSKENAEKYLAPAETLLNDGTLWHSMSDGLALFINGSNYEYYCLPVHFKKFVYISDHFYLKPLLPLFNGDDHFFILELSSNHVKLLKCTLSDFKEIPLEDFIPQNLEQAVGSDYEADQLMFRSGKGSNARPVVYGMGEGVDDKKIELTKYFRQIDNGLSKLFSTINGEAPLVVAATDELFSLYKKVNKYPHLYPAYIKENPDHEHNEVLHQKATRLLKDYFNKEKNDKVNAYLELGGTGRASHNLGIILPAAIAGRIDTLFINKNGEKWGRYDQGKVSFHHFKGDYDICLLNLAAIKTLTQKGKVYILDEEEMPDEKGMANALFRY